MLVKLISESSTREGFCVNRENLFNVFEIISATIGKIGIFSKLNSEDFLQTSTIEKIDISNDNILIETKNSKYTFRIL